MFFIQVFLVKIVFNAMNDSSETDSDEIKLYLEVQPKKVKRYNAGLYKNYNTSYRDKQCFRTISKWDTLGQRQHIIASKKKYIFIMSLWL